MPSRDIPFFRILATLAARTRRVIFCPRLGIQDAVVVIELAELLGQPVAVVSRYHQGCSCCRHRLRLLRSRSSSGWGSISFSLIGASAPNLQGISMPLGCCLAHDAADTSVGILDERDLLSLKSILSSGLKSMFLRASTLRMKYFNARRPTMREISWRLPRSCPWTLPSFIVCLASILDHLCHQVISIYYGSSRLFILPSLGNSTYIL